MVEPYNGTVLGQKSRGVLDKVEFRKEDEYGDSRRWSLQAHYNLAANPIRECCHPEQQNNETIQTDISDLDSNQMVSSLQGSILPFKPELLPQ